MLYAGGNKVMYCVLHTTTDRRWIGIESVIRTSMTISATRPLRPPLNRRYEDQPATAATTIIKPNTPSTAGVKIVALNCWAPRISHDAKRFDHCGHLDVDDLSALR